MKLRIIIMTCATILMLANCASLKNKWTPVGTWEYLVTDTPDGDAKGTIIITKTDQGYEGVIRSGAYGESAISNFSISDEKELSGSFFLAGYDFFLKGTFEDDIFTGQIESSIADPFPMTATRAIQ